MKLSSISMPNTLFSVKVSASDGFVFRLENCEPTPCTSNSDITYAPIPTQLGESKQVVVLADTENE